MANSFLSEATTFQKIQIYVPMTEFENDPKLRFTQFIVIRCKKNVFLYFLDAVRRCFEKWYKENQVMYQIMCSNTSDPPNQ
jgi:hypothetical protein